MVATVDKLQKLRHSVQKLEAALQEVWSSIDELNDDFEFKGLKKNAKQQRELLEVLSEFDSCMEEIPEDGTVAVDFEDAISELVDWLKVNK